jgi:hypothetical protein
VKRRISIVDSMYGPAQVGKLIEQEQMSDAFAIDVTALRRAVDARNSKYIRDQGFLPLAQKICDLDQQLRAERLGGQNVLLMGDDKAEMLDQTGAPDVTIQIRADGKVLWVNTTCCRLRICNIEGVITVEDARPKARKRRKRAS